MRYRKILITGFAGFIGYHVAKRLARTGIEVVGLDNINDYYSIDLKFDRLKSLGFNAESCSINNKLTHSKVYSNLSFIRIGVDNRETLPNIFNYHKFDAVIHLAAQAGVRYSLENPMAYVDSNLVGFMNILECCRHTGVQHLVYASSSSVYGDNTTVPFAESAQVDNPVSLYAATKKANELMAHTYSHLYNLPTSGLRFFTVYGPWGRPDMAPMLFASAICSGKPINVFNEGKMSRDFTYIDDIVEGILITLNSPPKSTNTNPFYQVFNIGNGSPVSLRDFIVTVEKKLSKEAKKIMLPMQAGDVCRTWADTSELEKLGYKSSISIDEGVEKFINWYLTYNK